VTKYVGPKVIPQGSTVELTEDCWVFEVHITNPSLVSSIVWVRDCQNPPIYMIPPTTIEPAGMISADSSKGRLFKGGLEWGSSSPEIHGWIYAI